VQRVGYYSYNSRCTVKPTLNYLKICLKDLIRLLNISRISQLAKIAAVAQLEKWHFLHATENWVRFLMFTNIQNESLHHPECSSCKNPRDSSIFYSAVNQAYRYKSYSLNRIAG
jgi:hypothetical protein